MRTRWRTALLAFAIATTIVAATVASSPVARAQTSSSGPTGDTGATSCPASNPPNELTLVGGTPQTAQLETGFANPLQVALANTNGCPMTTTLTATAVTFTAPTTGPSATFAASGSNALTVGTDATGSASVQMLTADDTAGAYTVTASSAYGSVSFALTNTVAGIPATITPLAPTSQHAKVDSHYSDPLEARVLDANGDPVVGATVTFTLGSGGGGSSGGSGASSAGATFDGGASQATETTNSDGVATSPGFTANATSGRFTAAAATAQVVEPAQFALENLSKGPETITRLGPADRQATVDTRYARRLQVQVRNADGSPIADATVTFSLAASSTGGAPAASSGAGATFTGGATEATETTGPHGIATSPRLAANNDAGSFTATASASGATGIALFHLSDRAGAPSTLTAGVGAAQSTTAGARFAIALAVTVSDAHGNKVPNTRVTFTAPSSGPGGSFTSGRTTVTVRTNSSGIAVAPAFTANGQAGGYIVTATVKGARAVAFALVNTAG